MMFYTTAINGVFAFLIAGGILLTRGGVTNGLLLNLIFYIIITPVIGTTLTKIMFMSEDAMIVSDAISRIDEVLGEQPLPEGKNVGEPAEHSITLDMSATAMGTAIRPAAGKMRWMIFPCTLRTDRPSL